MPQTSNRSNAELDGFSSAYQKEFKHYEENILMLSSYAEILCTALRVRGPLSMISFGIGHQVVCSRIMESLIDLLEEYTIIEGSSTIIESLYRRGQLPGFVRIEHNMFERYQPEEQVEAIEMGFVLEHVDDPASLLRKYRDFLSPKGFLYAAVPNARSLHRILGQEAGILKNIYQLSQADYQLGHQRYFDLQSFTQLLRSEGFIIQQVKGILLIPFTTAQLTSLKLPPNVLRAMCACAADLPDIANGIMIEASLDRTNE